MVQNENPFDCFKKYRTSLVKIYYQQVETSHYHDIIKLPNNL